MKKTLCKDTLIMSVDALINVATIIHDDFRAFILKEIASLVRNVEANREHISSEVMKECYDNIIERCERYVNTYCITEHDHTRARCVVQSIFAVLHEYVQD